MAMVFSHQRADVKADEEEKTKLARRVRDDIPQSDKGSYEDG